MARNGKDYGLIALGGFEHTLRTNEAKDRFAKDVDVSKMSITEQIKHYEKVMHNERIEKEAKDKAAKEKKDSFVQMGNLDYEIGRKNRLAMEAEQLAKGKKSR